MNNLTTSSLNKVSTEQLAQNLPMFDQAFDVSYSDANFNQTSHDGFSEAIYEFGTQESSKEPYMYGSYEIFEADTEN